MNPYHYLYYRLYCWTLRMDPGDSAGYHNFRAATLLSMSLFANIFTVAIIASWIPFLPSIHLPNVSQAWDLIFVVAFYAVQVIYFHFKDGESQIVLKYSDTLGRSSTFGAIYLIGSVVAYLGALMAGTFLM